MLNTTRSRRLVGTGRKYSFFINSEQKASGTNRAQYTYYVDWDSLPEGKYHVHFTYVGEENNLSAGHIAYVAVDFGASSRTQYITSTGNVTQTILGMLRPETLKGTISYLYADDTINEDIYLDNKPSSQFITVTIYENTVPPTLFEDDAGVPAQPAPYMLGLHFELLEEQ